MLVSLLIVLVGTIIPGCNRRKPEEAVAETETPEASDTREPEGGTTLQLTPEGRQRTESVLRSQPADPRDSAFASQRTLAIPAYPSDYRLGRLYRPSAGPMEHDASEYAREYLLAIRDGTSVSVESLGPGARNAVVELTGALSETASLRIGQAVVFTDEEVSVRFRFVQLSGSISGELIVALDGGDWYTSDIQTSRESGSEDVYEPGITETGVRTR
jgi:hypothetical protein